MEKSFESSKKCSEIIRSDIFKSGFIVNEEKSVWEPTQVMTWLGLIWDGANGTITITGSRVKKLQVSIDKLLEKPQTSARNLARVVGQIISTGPVTGILSRIMSRHRQLK